MLGAARISFTDISCFAADFSLYLEEIGDGSEESKRTLEGRLLIRKKESVMSMFQRCARTYLLEEDDAAYNRADR